MALKYPVPKLDWSLFGSGEEEEVVPFLKAPLPVEFARGSTGAEFQKAVAAASSVVVTAACGAGKSIDMPILLLKEYSMVIHVVAARNLAGDQAKFIAKKYPDKPVHFVDIDGELPPTGLVLMPAAQYMKQQLLWKKDGNPQDHVVYLDECHESDWATTVMRTLRHNMLGCRRFLMASATHGTGGAGSEFRAPILPAKLVTRTYANVDPTMWDLMAPGKPWSVDELESDMLIFIDSHEKAETVAALYKDVGIRAYRFTAHSSFEEFSRVKESLEKGFGGERVTVLILDYTYRFGYTFPTVGRIIDTAEVAYLEFTPDNKAAVPRFRKAYHAELVQTAARGARVAGRDCVYYRPEYTPQFAVLDTTGPDVDAAVLLFRMLGYKPPKLYSGTPYYSGGLPAHAPRVLAGPTPIRCYADERVDWPVVEKMKRSVKTLQKAEYGESECGSPVADVGEHKEPYVEEFVDSERERRKRESGEVSYDSAGFRAAVESLSLGDKEAIERHRRRRVPLMTLGEYYFLPGLAIKKVTRYPEGFKSVLATWGTTVEDWAVLKTAERSVIEDVEQEALLEFNEASALVSAAAYALNHVKSKVVPQGRADPGVVSDWVADVQGMHDKAAALGTSAGRMVEFLRPGEVVIDVVHADREKHYLDQMLEMLYARVHQSQAVPTDHSNYHRMLEERRVHRQIDYGGYPMVFARQTSGRYVMETGGSGVRKKVAAWLLRGEEPVVSVYAPGDEIAVAGSAWDAKKERLNNRFLPSSVRGGRGGG